MILASQSPRRQSLLADAGFCFDVCVSHIDETPYEGEPPEALVQRLAQEKAFAVAQHLAHAADIPSEKEVIPCNNVESTAPTSASHATQSAAHAATGGELILAADTVVSLQNVILGKPSSSQEAKHMLRTLCGTTHQVSTGVALVRADIVPHLIDSFVDTAHVSFFERDDALIDAYVASNDPLDKAGAYGIQDQIGRLLIKEIQGDFYTVMGLPIARVYRLLTAAGEQTQLTTYHVDEPSCSKAPQPHHAR
ncbi:septum formation protein Maf [Collinsella sp. zg1085]|uniref:Maf family protein n=1 Tax=Collinsella sp. zg1085 TaxID=2844380 RepID=UPI001C0C1C49|nr:Maf family protein [Collinsella sp. zg1085]QWT18009.1 septum formation protein Maf [Collinsella sp. zg1085]